MDPDQPTHFSWQEFIEQHRWLILTALLGLALLGLGVRYLKTSNQPERVEIIPLADSPSISSNIAIDVGGSVNQPGVYHLPSGSRVADAITAAGGLTGDADIQWVQRALNQAEKLKDGQKIYILNSAESADLSTGKTIQASGLPEGIIAGANTSGTVSINSASQSELEALWGIGPVTAQAIIDSRPFSSAQELLDKKIIKQNVWDRNKDKLSL